MPRPLSVSSPVADRRGTRMGQSAFEAAPAVTAAQPA